MTNDVDVIGVPVDNRVEGQVEIFLGFLDSRDRRRKNPGSVLVARVTWCRVITILFCASCHVASVTLPNARAWAPLHKRSARLHSARLREKHDALKNTWTTRTTRHVHHSKIRWHFEFRCRIVRILFRLPVKFALRYSRVSWRDATSQMTNGERTYI